MPSRRVLAMPSPHLLQLCWIPSGLLRMPAVAMGVVLFCLSELCLILLPFVSRWEDRVEAQSLGGADGGHTVNWG